MVNIGSCWSVIYRSSGGAIPDGFRECNGIFYSLQNKSHILIPFSFVLAEVYEVTIACGQI